MDEDRQQLVLGAATGYRPDEISVFIDSLKNTGFRGATALLVDRSNPALQRYLTDASVEVIVVDLVPRWMPAWLRKRRFSGGRMRSFQGAVADFANVVPARLMPLYAIHVVSAFHHISTSRYFHYRRYLETEAHRFSHVLLADVRDVAFQADPFAGIPPQCLWFFQEYTGQTLGSQAANRRWIETAYGNDGLAKIQHNGILCSGTTLGSTTLVRDYARRLAAELIRLTPMVHGGFGFDQAALNWLHWTGSFPEAEIKQNFAGAVATLQLESPELFEFDAEGRLLNRDGRPAPILHQYDRHPEIFRRVLDRRATGQTV